MKQTFLFVLALGIMLTSCEKFDDGGSVGKADKTITETLWKIESATDLEDGSNITGDYTGDIWEFTSDLEFKVSSEMKGTYEFADDNLSFTITENDGGKDTYWIDRLDSEAMWLTILGEEELRFVPN